VKNHISDDILGMSKNEANGLNNYDERKKIWTSLMYRKIIFEGQWFKSHTQIEKVNYSLIEIKFTATYSSKANILNNITVLLCWFRLNLSKSFQIRPNPSFSFFCFVVHVIIVVVLKVSHWYFIFRPSWFLKC
jgi:hypothetical protein